MATDLLDMDIDLDRMGLPVANEENKFLEVEVQRKQKQISELNGQLSEYNERVAAMREHMKNVRQELQHTQVIVIKTCWCLIVCFWREYMMPEREI